MQFRSLSQSTDDHSRSACEYHFLVSANVLSLDKSKHPLPLLTHPSLSLSRLKSNTRHHLLSSPIHDSPSLAPKFYSQRTSTRFTNFHTNMHTNSAHRRTREPTLRIDHPPFAESLRQHVHISIHAPTRLLKVMPATRTIHCRCLSHHARVMESTTAVDVFIGEAQSRVLQLPQPNSTSLDQPQSHTTTQQSTHTTRVSKLSLTVSSLFSIS